VNQHASLGVLYAVALVGLEFPDGVQAITNSDESLIGAEINQIAPEAVKNPMSHDCAEINGAEINSSICAERATRQLPDWHRQGWLLHQPMLAREP
jgi:hypothetical protein